MSNWPQKRVWGLLKNIKSFVLSGNDLKLKFLGLCFAVFWCSAKTTYPGKFQFLNCGQLYSWLIRSEYFSILNNSGMDCCLTWIFCTWTRIAVTETSKQIGSVRVSSFPGMLSANEIWVLFDHQYLLKGLVSGFDFVHVGRH